MITFDSVTLKSFIEENQDFFTGARIQKIQQPTRREFILSLRNNGEVKKLYVNINPQYYHVCFINPENEKKRLIEIPKQPPMFCMLLRKYLENARISKINQPKYERILELYIETYNELSEKIYLCLAIELMGKHSNIVLYNFDTNLIIGCAHNIGSEKSREREVIGGLPYVYPPHHSDSWYVNENSISKLTGSINDNIDKYYAEIISNDKFKKMQEKFLQSVNKKLKRVNNSLSQINRQTITKEKADKYRRYGDMIMANLYANKDFINKIDVHDWENNQDITIELDETKTLKENANKFYKLYNKAKTSNNKLKELSENLQVEKIYLEQLIYSIEYARDIEDLNEISFEIEPDTKKEQKKSEISEIKGENYIIYIGKNNRQNDYIVSKLARDNDLWFHTKDCAGSHVLLRTDNVTDDLIYKCAQFAKEYSKGSKSSKIGVIYTFAKNLKKPPKANLGYVIYKGEKEIVI